MGWWESAACKDRTDLDWFPAERSGRNPVSPEIAELCAGCPVRDACLADALGEGAIQSGVRAGLSASERERLRERGVRVVRVDGSRCGTDWGYKLHRRAGESACVECKAAHAATQRGRVRGRSA